MSRYRMKTESVMHSFYVFFCADEEFNEEPIQLTSVEAPNGLAAVENAVALYDVAPSLAAAVIRAEHITWAIPVGTEVAS